MVGNLGSRSARHHLFLFVSLDSTNRIVGFFPSTPTVFTHGEFQPIAKFSNYTFPAFSLQKKKLLSSMGLRFAERVMKFCMHAAGIHDRTAKAVNAKVKSLQKRYLSLAHTYNRVCGDMQTGKSFHRLLGRAVHLGKGLSSPATSATCSSQSHETMCSITISKYSSSQWH